MNAIRLRLTEPKDIADYHRWFSTEKEWTKWDAPWEKVDDAFEARYIEKVRTKMESGNPDPGRFEIESDGRHIGWVSSYWMAPDRTRLAVGIIIAESGCWGKGIGKQALAKWIDFLFEHRPVSELWCETWSGNVRMVKLALSSGFLVHEDHTSVIVEGLSFRRMRFRLQKR
jgi:RimJ/RimL family protein N-acetyltransferase